MTDTPPKGATERRRAGGAPGRTVERPLALFTYHPLTASGQPAAGGWAEQALRATLDVCGTVVATHPGMDAGREEILAALTSVAAEDERLLVVEALGTRYPAVLASCDVVVGNSSRGSSSPRRSGSRPSTWDFASRAGSGQTTSTGPTKVRTQYGCASPCPPGRIPRSGRPRRQTSMAMAPRRGASSTSCWPIHPLGQSGSSTVRITPRSRTAPPRRPDRGPRR